MVATTNLSERVLNASAGNKRAGATLSGQEARIRHILRDAGLGNDSDYEVRSLFAFILALQ